MRAKEQEQVKSTRRRPTKQQQAFIENMADPTIKTQTEAYLKAYPNVSYRTAMANSSRMLRNAMILNAIEDRKQRAIAHCRVSPEEVLGGAAFQMRSSIDDILGDDGSFSIEKARTTGAVDLIKRHKETIRTVSDKQGRTATIKIVEVEMLTNQDGRKEVAEYIGLNRPNHNLFNERTERLAALKKAIEARAIEKGVTYQQELKNYLDNYAAPGIKELMQAELETK